MAELAEGGAVAFSDDGSPVLTPGLLRSALAYAKTLGAPIMDHCEEPSYVGCAMHEGHVSTRLGLRGQPAAAEDAMVARGIQLAELTGGHFHAAHMSTLGGLDLVRRAKERGIPITAEVAPHHLTLTDEWVAGGPRPPRCPGDRPLRPGGGLRHQHQGQPPPTPPALTSRP